MKKILLPGISLILLIPLAPLTDWAYYRDRKTFIPPIRYTGEAPVRDDSYGDGHFGARRSGGRAHKGLDIEAPLRGEVMASKGGRAEVKFQKNGMGKYIIIKHPGGYSTLYGHLAEYGVGADKRVRQGAVIGYVGKTGNAKYKRIKAHLHFEIRKNNEPIDPLTYLK